MGATNSTTYYNLSQFVGSDKPAWLQDYNGDMAKIDAGIKGALTAAQSAQSTADLANTDVTQLASDVGALQTTVAGHTSDIGDLGGDVNTIEALIGNGTPTTTDQTIIGAINELNSKIGDTPNLETSVSIPIGSDYVVPSDGYVTVTCNSTKTSYGQISVNGQTLVQIASIDGSYTGAGMGTLLTNSLYVRKGMTVKVTGSTGVVGYFRAFKA